MEFRIARAARITGEMLKNGVEAKLQELKIKAPECVVCYGAGYAGNLPALNAHCSTFNKLEQTRILSESLGAESLVVASTEDMLNLVRMTCPWVARRVRHSKGRDMRVCRTPHGMRAAARNHDFFTPIVPSDTEYRVWVYRKRVLCVYEKRLTEPEKNTKFGRNRANGWTFHGLNSENIPEALRRVSVAAVSALGLDFGAVDVLGSWVDADHTDIHPTVLEVNSAPGVSDEHRTAIVKMVNRVVKWIVNGCPARDAA